MKINKTCLFLVGGALLAQSACIGSRFGSQKKDKVELKPLRNDVLHNAMVRAKLQDQPLTLKARIDSGKRGVVSMYGGSLVSFGINAVDSLISKNKKKYTETWTCAKNDFYFYDQPSPDGPFDPVGMQFTGFVVNRNIKIDKHDVTAVHAEFEVNTEDDTASAQIINDGVFRLKLKDISVRYAKAKVPLEKQQINLDFEITFTTSYLTKEGQFYTDVQLGKFLFSLRHAPLDSVDHPDKFNHYYDSVKKKSDIIGKCIIVPRSYGYYKVLDSTKRSFTLAPFWNQGNFSIDVKVTESSKDDFTGVLLTSAGVIVDTEGSVLSGSKSASKSSGGTGKAKQ